MKYAKPRLSALMFIQTFVLGATLPIISLYMIGNLGFTGAQTGLALGLGAVSSIVSPLFMTFIADRLISSERLLCLLNLAGGVCMMIFAAQTEFYPALIMYVVHSVITNPTLPLIYAITFRHSPAERRKFGNIRVWGTVGWISVAWIFSFGILRDGGGVSAGDGSKLPLLLTISAVTSFITAAYALTIPRKRDLSGDSGSRPRFWDAAAFRIILQPRVLALSVIAAAITFSDKFYHVGTAPFLKYIGFSERDIMPAMSLGQIPEIFGMVVLGYLLKRWGVKKVLIAGMVLKVFRFGICAFFETDAFLIYTSLSVHGLAYTLTMVTALICLDGFCTDRERSGVHQLFSVITAGIGGFLGSYAAGWVVDIFTTTCAAGSEVVNYSGFWIVAFVLTVIITAVMWIAWPKNAGKLKSEG